MLRPDPEIKSIYRLHDHIQIANPSNFTLGDAEYLPADC